MSAHVLLNLLNEMGNMFNKFSNTGARMLDFIYHIKLTRYCNITRAHYLDMVNCKIKYLQRKNVLSQPCFNCVFRKKDTGISFTGKQHTHTPLFLVFKIVDCFFNIHAAIRLDSKIIIIIIIIIIKVIIKNCVEPLSR